MLLKFALLNSSIAAKEIYWIFLNLWLHLLNFPHFRHFYFNKLIIKSARHCLIVHLPNNILAFPYIILSKLLIIKYLLILFINKLHPRYFLSLSIIIHEDNLHIPLLYQFALFLLHSMLTSPFLLINLLNF